VLTRGRGKSFAERHPDLFPILKHESQTPEATMKVILKSAYTVAVDGIHPATFPAGEAELPASIAAVLLEDGRATLPAPSEEKMLPRAPENKMVYGAPEARKRGKWGKKG
jgi:hypothetical protein